MALWQSYHTPTTIHEALSLLLQYAGKAQLIAGGTDLILDMQYNQHPPLDALVDVTTIAGLNEIHVDGEWIVLGAAVTHTQIEENPLLKEHGMAVVESCSVVGGPQVRNVATIGGNVAHALPAADGAIGLLALDAQVQLCTLTPSGLEFAWQPLLSIYAGPGRNNLQPNQMLGAFRFALRLPHQASAFARIMRPQGVALPILGVAARITLDAVCQKVVDAVIAIGPAGPLPFRATGAEALLTQAPAANDEAIAVAVAAAQAQAQLRTSKHRASKEYRHEMVGVLLRRVLHTAINRARGEAE
jgi:CO/xanthine dehydrogenase FAD-binding subunit